jgi:integrase
LNFDAAQAAARTWFTGPSTAGRSPLTVKEAFRQYITYLKRQRSPSAVYNAEGALLGLDGKRGPRKCTLAHLHDVLLSDLKKGQLEAWQDAQITAKDDEGKRRQQDTCNRVLNAIKAALTRAADDDDNKYPAEAPRAWERVKAFEDVGRRREVFLTEDDANLLIGAVESKALKNLVRGAFLIGLRPGIEMNSLHVGDFKAADGSLAIRRSKTGARTVWLSDEAVALLTELTAGRKPDAPLFVRDDGEPWGSDAHSWNRPLKAAAERAGLPSGRGMCLYTSGRHSHASVALSSKDRAPTLLVAENLGTSERMLSEHYQKFIERERRQMLQPGSPKLGQFASNVAKMRGRK